MHEVLVNRLGGLSLPRKSVVRLTDRPDMTLDVYRGRKTTTQQPINDTPFELHIFQPSDAEHIIKLTFSESISLSLETRLMMLLMMTLLNMPQEMSNVPA